MLGDIYNAKKEYKQASTLYQDAYNIYKNRYGNNFKSERIGTLLPKLANLGIEMRNTSIYGLYFRVHQIIFGVRHLRTMQMVKNSILEKR